MSEQLSFRRQLAALLRDYWRLVKRHPWLITPPGLVWLYVMPRDERQDMIRRATGEQLANREVVD